ncbi:MAG: DUF2752 domain-containing protein [Bacteroidales bacterium]|nr:DUF2752 domain-containing protein [Bacteroidales bacterium]
MYKFFFGIECPTCGFQRSLIFLLQGHLLKSIITYPPLIPTLVLSFLVFLQLTIKKPGWMFIKRFALVDLLIIFSNYIFKLIVLYA